MIVVLTGLIRLPLRNIPFERDEGEYAYIAWRLEHNELPYRDWVDQKPPAIFWVYRAALSLPLDAVCAVHCVAMLFAAASAVALYFLSSRFVSQFWATIAACMLVILSADPSIQGTAANTELFMLLPLILSQSAFFRAAQPGRRQVAYMFLAGVLTGLAVAFKQVAAVNWGFQIAMFPIVAGHDKKLRNALCFTGWSTAGVAVVWGVVVTYFAFRQGVGELVYNVFTHNLEYISSISWPTRLKACAETLGVLARTELVAWAVSAIGFLALLLARRLKVFAFTAGWMIASIIGLSASGYFFPHYFQQTLPALCLTAAIGAEAVCRFAMWRRVPGWCRALTVVAVLAAMPMCVVYPYLFVYSPEDSVRRIYPGNAFAEMPELGRRLAKVTSDSDRVFIFGAEPELLFYARRASATRYIFLFPLYGPYRDAREKQVSAVNEIVRAQPMAAVAIPNGLFFAPGTDQYFTQWTGSYLQQTFRDHSYLTITPPGVVRIVAASEYRQASLPEEKVFGRLVVRRDR